MDLSQSMINAAGALGHVAAVGLVLGAGLPALFALGIRCLDGGRTVTVAGAGPEVPRPSPASRLGAVVCFGLCVLAVAFGIVVIIGGKQLFGG